MTKIVLSLILHVVSDGSGAGWNVSARQEKGEQGRSAETRSGKPETASTLLYMHT